MLGKLLQIIDTDQNLLKSLPLWAAVLLLAVWVIPFGVCLYRDQKSMFSRWGESRNTIHTMFWMSVMLLLPCVGSVLYLAGSLLPGLLWEKRGGRGAFPLAFRLRKGQLAAVTGTLAVPFLLSVFVPAPPEFLARYDWCFDLSFLCTVGLLFTDWLLTVHRCAVYLRTSPKEAEDRQDGTVLSVPRYRTASTSVIAPHLLRKEGKRMRQMADTIFRHHVYDAELPGKHIRIMADGAEQACQVVGTRQDWLGTRPDFMEMRYIGRGITRCRISTWEERFGKLRCTESILYRAVPGLTGWAKRACILLTLQLTFGASQAADIHTNLLELLTRWIAG